MPSISINKGRTRDIRPLLQWDRSHFPGHPPQVISMYKTLLFQYFHKVNCPIAHFCINKIAIWPVCGFPITWKSAGSFLDEQSAHHIYAVIEIPSEASPQTCLPARKDEKEGECEVRVWNANPVAMLFLRLCATVKFSGKPDEPGEVHWYVVR